MRLWSCRSLGLCLLTVVFVSSTSCDSDEEIAAAINANPSTGDFVVYAQRKVKLGEHSKVFGGDVGVAKLAPVSVGPQLVVERRSFVEKTRNLIAPSIKLERRAFVGDVQTDALTNQGARVGGTAPYPLSMPPLPTAAAPGGSGGDIFVRHHHHDTLSPGAYGDLKIFGTLVLRPGMYSFASIKLGDGADLLAQGDVDVRVAGRLEVGRGAKIGPAHGRPATFNLGVAGRDSRHDAAAFVDDHATITALLAVPRGTLRIGDHVDATGAFAAFDVLTGDHVKFTFQGGFTPVTGTQPITSYVFPPPSPVVGPVAPDATIALAVGLPLRDLSALQALIDLASDPNSATYRQYLSAASLKAVYAPTDADYAAVVAWAQARNLKLITHANNLGLSVSGTAAQIEQAFHANLIRALRSDGTEFYQVDGRPSVDLGVQLLGVSGLDNHFVARIAAGSAPIPNTYQSSDLRGAYLSVPGGACSGLDGAGQSIGIFSLSTGFTPSDITDYEANTGLTGVPAVIVETSDDPNGLAPAAAPPLPSAGNLYGVELSLDIQMAIAMAPAAQVVVFEGQQQDSILMNMTNHPEILQFSTSWLFGPSALRSTLMTAMAALGQSFITGSGDWGVVEPPSELLNCPADVLTDVADGDAVLDGVTLDLTDVRSERYITIVGGTQLSTAGGLWSSEVVWPGSGGGIFPAIPMPTYQANANPGNPEVSTTNRNMPDVALVATQIYIVTTTCAAAMASPFDPCPAAQQVPGTAIAVGGTSASSPLFAGFVALINQQGQSSGRGPIGFLNRALYDIGGNAARYANAFHDIGSTGGGTATNVCGFTYNAQAGYDLISGWGTPRCGLVTELNGSVQPSIAVVATEGAQGVRFCVQGQGFQPGSLMHFTFSDLPASHANVNSLEMVLVGSGGRFTNFDPTFGGGASSLMGHIQFCDAQDATELMTVRAFDVNDPSIFATAQISNTWVCGFEPTQTPMNQTPLPFPVLNTTTCPLPPD